MVKIVPVINVKTRQDFEKRLHQLKKFNGLIQIDVADGQFTDWKNLQDISEIKRLKIKKDFELHLMIKKPELSLKDWLSLKPKRVFIQHEAINDSKLILRLCKEYKVELGLAFKPYTDLEVLKELVGEIKSVLLLGVEPGPSGQKFRYHVLDRIKELKKKYPKLILQLDGGVNEEVAQMAKEANVDELAMGSYIFKSDNPCTAITHLQEKLK